MRGFPLNKKCFGLLLGLAVLAVFAPAARAKSVADARRDAKEDPQSANEQYNLGLAIMQDIERPLRSGRLNAEQTALAKEAEGAFGRALKLADNHGRAHIMLGMLLDMTGQSAAAVPHLRKGMTLPPDSDDWMIAATTLVSAYFNQEKSAPAEPVLKEILEHYPNDAKAWHRLGLVYETTGRGALAVEAQQKAVALGYGSQARDALARAKASQRGGGKTEGEGAGAAQARAKTPARAEGKPSPRVSVPASAGDLERAQIAYVESEDAVAGRVYAYVAYTEKNTHTGEFKVIVNGNTTSGVSFDPAQAVFKRKISEAQAKGLSYFVHGFQMKPSSTDARAVENRVWFDSSGRPTYLEIVLVTRNADGSPRPAAGAKVPWPRP